MAQQGGTMDATPSERLNEKLHTLGPQTPIPVDSQKLHRQVNRWAARFTPFMLVGAVGYATWTMIALLCGVAILVIYCCLLLAMTLCYGRLLWTVFFDNAYVPLEPSNKDQGLYLDRRAIIQGNVPAPLGLDAFTRRDIYECDVDGLPRWCSTCKIWKPDRSHHCSQVGRCVYKMDHFCPWAGGVVCETSFKFFIQFCCYAAVYCLFVVIVTAYSLTLLDKSSFYGRNTAATLALGAMFGVFSGSLGSQSLQFASKNTTTIDNLGHSTKIYNFAVRQSGGCPAGVELDATITFPLQGYSSPERKTFRVWQTPLGYNPYDLGSAAANLQSTMGVTMADWLLPVRYSPSSSFLTNGLEVETGTAAMYRVRNAVEAVKKP